MSKKNSRRLFTDGSGRIRLAPSARAQKQEDAIAATARVACGSRKDPVWPSEDVEVRIDYHARSGRCNVEFECLGPRPKGFAGRRRDLHSVIDVLADAVQGIVYANDNQVARVVVTRHLD